MYGIIETRIYDNYWYLIEEFEDKNKAIKKLKQLKEKSPKTHKYYILDSEEY